MPQPTDVVAEATKTAYTNWLSQVQLHAKEEGKNVLVQISPTALAEDGTLTLRWEYLLIDKEDKEPSPSNMQLYKPQ